MSPKIITRIKGGLGNQLFCYAAARRLALVNNVELVIDDVTGFSRDRQYGRRYMLDHFDIPARKATPAERLEPFERCRRGLMKLVSHRKTFTDRLYLEQEGLDFDERLLSLKVDGTLYLDGLWQSEGYFKDIEQTVRKDLRIIPPRDELNQSMADRIGKCNAVALHVRWFDSPGNKATHSVSPDYYRRAVELMEKKVESPNYFVFSDKPEVVHSKIALPENRMVLISHNTEDDKAYADLWLMVQCRHFITANSTFSWWGAWLSGSEEKIVVTPDLKLNGKTAWGFKGLIAAGWTKL